jgi:hypothetical protein
MSCAQPSPNDATKWNSKKTCIFVDLYSHTDAANILALAYLISIFLQITSPFVSLAHLISIF